MSEFAKRLVTERERLGLTLTAFGSKAGVGVRLQAQFEVTRHPPLPYLLRLDEMARSDNVVFSATGITKGDLLDGITRKGNMATTETLLIRGKSRTIRRIQSIHYLDRKDPDIQQHIL